VTFVGHAGHEDITMAQADEAASSAAPWCRSSRIRRHSLRSAT